MPSHRADTPPLRRPRGERSASRTTTRSESTPVNRAQSVLAPSASQPARPPVSKPVRRRAPGRALHPSLTSLSAPQVGIAGVLGIATIAAPISGAMASPATKLEANTVVASPIVASAAFPALPGAGGTVLAANAMPSTALPAAEIPSLIRAPRTVLVTRASRSGERSVLPGCDGVAKITDAPNGRIPASALCTLWDSKHRLRADAAVALAKLNVAYKQHFGSNMCLTDSYRTLSEQYAVRAAKPTLAAVPGTSNHGWGLAVDLGCGVEKNGTSRYEWLRENAGAYGWENPDWALPGGSGPHEAWHWEYYPGTDAIK